MDLISVIFMLYKASALCGLMLTLTSVHMVTTEAILFITRDEWSSFHQYTDRKLTSGHWLSFPSCPVASFHYLHPFTAEPRRDTWIQREEKRHRQIYTVVQHLQLLGFFDKFPKCNQMV